MSKSWKISKTIASDLKAFFVIKGCLFAIALCFVSSIAFGQLKKAPLWVREVPVNGDAYYGMGTVNMKEYPEYRAKARQMALREIVEKIFVSVSSSSLLTMTYENDEVDYLLDETVSLASSNFLSGHQKVDDWVDKRSNQYYVLFKLDVDAYNANRKAYFSTTESIIKMMQNEAAELFRQGEVVRGINRLNASIKKLDDDINRLTEPEYQALLQKWRLASIYELERQIDQIGFNTKRRYQFNATKSEALVIDDILVNKATGIPLSGIELELKTIQGEVFRYSFDHEHHEALSIYGMYPMKKVAIIQIIADLNLDKDVKQLIDPSVKQRLESAPIVIEFAPFQIAYNLEGEYYPRGLTTSRSVSYLRKVTEDLGLLEVYENVADYQISIGKVGKVKRYRSGYYYGDIAIKITIIDPNTDREVYRHIFPKKVVKVNKPELALNNAFNQSLDEMDQFLVGFISSLCALHF
ncbi:MAG: LPP20 family lipoprotein [Bacteroidota bacterium]